MTEEQLKKLRAILLQELTEHEQAEETISLDNEEIDGVANHPADEATDLQDKMTDLAMQDFHETEVEKIQQALQAIEEGTYGKCTECAEEIPYERLEAIPTALTCVEHATA